MLKTVPSLLYPQLSKYLRALSVYYNRNLFGFGIEIEVLRFNGAPLDSYICRN